MDRTQQNNNDIHDIPDSLKSLTVDELPGVIPDLIFILDGDGVIIEYGAGNESDLYLAPEQFLHKPMFSVLPEEPATLILDAFQRVKSTHKLHTAHYKLSIDGQCKWFEARVAQSSEHRFILLVRDMTPEKSKEEEILYQANHDHLTGLYNRGYAFESMEHELKKAALEGIPLALFYIDIDDFKDINDQYGHVTGDKVILTIAQSIQNSVRKSDIVCRIGGDEFVVIACGDFTHDILEKTAQKILHTISAEAEQLKLDRAISVSLGVTHSYEGNISCNDLIKRADLAMYEAKSKGKRGYVIFEEPIFNHPQSQPSS
ncbi:GGDEF domain-containing protein [Pseudoalteromonas sp. SSDWG2]|uniref:GGDEF domain-containing protein n=1 Tax=Pseudoalteromonas sp. SSDWG2 TaxID=3139391 RepID=UPI003BA9C32A